MKRDELLRSSGYWTAKIQIDLFNEVEKYMKRNNLNRKQLAEQLGVSKGYITQLLNGDFDNRISKLVELSLAIGVIPDIHFKETNTYVLEENTQNHPVLSTESIEEYRNLLHKCGYLTTKLTNTKNESDSLSMLKSKNNSSLAA